MNLVPQSTGDLRPTCDGEGPHAPLLLYFEGQPIRFIIRPGLALDKACAWVLADVAKALGIVDHKSVIRKFSEGGEKGEDLILTPGGPQTMRTLTYAGLTRMLMRSDKETAVRFQSWLAAKSSDLTFYGVAFRNESAAEGLSMAGVVAALETRFDAKLEGIAEEGRAMRRYLADIQTQNATQAGQLASLQRAFAGAPASAKIVSGSVHPLNLSPYSAAGELQRIAGHLATSMWRLMQ